MTQARFLAVEIDQLLGRAAPLLAPSESEAAQAIRDRLAEPIRVAIAGRVKAGKSTALNALVGERLAPTDAGECTKIVTWYRHGLTYAVMAELDDGDRVPVPFERQQDRLVLDVSGLDAERVERLDVTWPSERLRRLTLIDTPGLEGHDEAAAARTRRVLGLDDDVRSEVDAVIYLMRHAHQLDVEFLEAFGDRSLANPSPVNAIGVLSRADEIGSGRADALESAANVAERYAADPRIHALCATVVPMAGLIAETGRTLLESEGSSLRAIGGLPDDERESMVVSVDRFVDPDRSRLDAATRHDLLLRLGLYGVRFGVDLMAQHDATSSDLSRALVRVSGVDDLARLVDDHFGRRADLLKSKSALGNLRSLLATLPNSAEATAVRNDFERVEATAPELGELRLLHLVISGSAGFDDEQTDEVDRLIGNDAPAERVGLEANANPEVVRARIIARVDDWRRQSAYALASAEQREACEIMATEYERLYAELSSN